MSRRLSSAAIFVYLLLFAGTILRAQTPPPLNPKVVLQTLPFGGVELAAWTPDDRYIITAGNASRTVLIWDAKTGHVVDRIALPGGASQTSTSTRRLTRMTVSDDGTTVSIREMRINAAASRFDQNIFSGNPTTNYTINLATREISRSATGGGVSRTTDVGAELQARQSALMASARTILENARKARQALEAKVEGNVGALGDADKELLPLPSSHDGKRSLVRTRDGLVVKQAGQENFPLELQRNLRFRDAALSPDGALLAMLPQPPLAEAGAKKKKPSSTIELFDTTTGQYQSPVTLPGEYYEVKWINSSLLFATGSSDPAVNADSEPMRGAVIDANSGAVMEWAQPQCYLKAFADGSYLGAGLANCRQDSGGDLAVKRFDPEKLKWRNLTDPGLKKGETIQDLVGSPTGRTLATLIAADDSNYRATIFDAKTGAITHSLVFDKEGVVSKILLLDDGILFVASDSGNAIWDMAADSWDSLPLKSSKTRFVEANDFVVAAAGTGDDNIELMDLETGERLPGLPFGRVIAGGFLPETQIFWALSAHDGLRFWDTSSTDWVPLFTTYFFADQGFVTVTPEGRYDTNLGPDTSLFRWVVPDQPFQSLAPQTFMRDYFTPGLAQQVLMCTYFQDCAATLAELKPISELNRILPQVEITKVEQTDAPDLVKVSVVVRETEDLTAPPGKTKSGVYNLRLFRDFRYADQSPNDQDLENQNALEDWRKYNRLVDDDDVPGDGIYHKTFDIFLPTAADKTQQIFTAYAFNEDRVKSETAEYLDYVRPDMKPVQPRAFVISIGIDAYDEKNLNLDYAAADAKLLGQSLAKIPGYEMHNLVVTAEADNTSRPTADAINMIFAMLAGLERKQGLKMLASAGIDGSTLDMVRPDDIVIFTFSGHGWADPQRNFFMVPTDGVWDKTHDAPLAHTLVNMEEMTMWLRLINAAEIVMIIDACHAGASVDTGSFKPGPMGDPGLGQLAYDKGIKILVATQAEDVALESSKLKQGLLTFALAGKGEGLAKADGMVDGQTDGKITLDEWINYPLSRLPTLNDDKRVTGGNAEMQNNSFRFPNRTIEIPKKVQQPTLFDYGDYSPVILRRIRK